MKVIKLKLGMVLMTFASSAFMPLSVLADQSIDERWDVESNVTVSVENVAGEIDIQGWDRNEVRLTGELGDSVEELEVKATVSSLQITVINRGSRNIDSTDLYLKVPMGAAIDASAVSADVYISGLDNEKLTAASVSGDVGVEATSMMVSIESVSGDVEFNGKTSRITAESVSGDVDLFGISGDIEATTVSGDMELQAGMIKSGKLETVSGDMAVEGKLSDDGRLTSESMSGDVTILLPASQAGMFKAQSFSGQISTDFGSVKRAKHGPGSSLKYLSGDGGAEIRIESFSGNIELQKN